MSHLDKVAFLLFRTTEQLGLKKEGTMFSRPTVLVMVLLMVMALAACGNSSSEDENRELVIMTHDSFNIGEDVIKEFEEANNATVVIQPAGDTGEALVRAILEKGNPSADLFYGIDNTYLGRALDEGIFDTYEPEGLHNIPEQFILDGSHHVTSIDYGYVNLNYDKAALAEAGLEPPVLLEQLTGRDWKGKLVCDDFGGYKASFELGVTEIGCMAHARRKFFELHATNKSQLAEQALRYIQLLYEIESEVQVLEPDLRQ